VQLNHAQLLALVDGMDWKRVRSVPVSRLNRLGKSLRQTDSQARKLIQSMAF
jgi:transposase